MLYMINTLHPRKLVLEENITLPRVRADFRGFRFGAIGVPHVFTYSRVRFLPVTKSTDAEEDSDVIEPFLDST